MIIILIGPPGSGKGTQGLSLAKHFNFFYIEVGKLLRKNAEHNPELKKVLDSGSLVEPSYVNNILSETLEDDNSYNYVLDGYPRSLAQAHYLDSKHQNHELLVLYYKVSTEILIKRLSGRMACASCEYVYNKYSLQPTVPGVCDQCGGQNFNFRADDNIEIIGKRIEEYKKNTSPLIDFYEKNNIISIIDGEKNINEIYENSVKLIKNFLNKNTEVITTN